MPQYYLSRPDGSYSDLANYSAEPATRTDGTWTAGSPPSGTQVYQAPNLLSQLNTLFLTLSPSDQLAYAPYLGTIYALISSGNTAEAKALLSGITVDSTAQSAQTAMLALFP